MSLTQIKSLPKLAGTLAGAGPWSSLLARAGHRIYPYQLGAMVRSTSTGTTISLHGKGDATANDYVIFCDATAYGNGTLFIPNLNKIRRISSVSSSDDQVTLGTSVSVTAGDYMLVIGADTASNPLSSPNYDGTTISLFDDNAGNNTHATKYFQTATGGTFIGWVTSYVQAVDLLISNSSGAPLVVWPMHPTLPLKEVNAVKTFTASDTTPSVVGHSVFKTNNSSPTTITNFTGGYAGQEITIIFGDANTTISDNSNIKIGAAFTSTADDVMTLVYDGTAWYEKGRSVN